MSNDKDVRKPDDPAPPDREQAERASREARTSTNDNEELDEGLEESFPGSDAPASTRRSGKD